MAVYQYGSNPQAWAVPLSSGILEYRKQVAAEQEAARKAALATQAAYEKARKTSEKARIAAEKARQKAKEERLKEFGPNTDQEIADLGYSGPGHFRTAADRWGEFSTGDQKPLSDAATKRLMTEQELAALSGGAGGTTKRDKQIRKLQEQITANIEPGVPNKGIDIDAEKLKFKIRQKEIAEEKKAQEKEVQAGIDLYGQLSTPTQAGMQGMGYDDYSKDIAAQENLAKVIAAKQEALKQAEIKRQQKEANAIRAAELFENPIATTSQTRRNELRSTEEMYGPVGSNLEGVTLNVPTALKNAIRGKTYTELVRKPRELSLWDKIKARAGGDVRVGSDEEYIIHGVGQTRIDNMASKLTDEVLIETGDVTKQAARQIAVRMFGGTANTTQLGAQATRIEANIKRLVDSGEITLVNVTGVGDAMQVHAVSVDKLKEQLQDKIPGYIASNDNRVRNIGGIMVEYNPTINRYFILQGLSDTFSEPRFGN